MCKAFSCIIDRDKKVWWKLGVDSHSKLIDISPYTDKEDCKKFVRVEITPDNNDYFSPNNWTSKIDSSMCPRWYSPSHEKSCFTALSLWISELEKYLNRKPIIHPFHDVRPPKRINKKIKLLLKDWDSVWLSVRDSVGDSVRDSVGDSVRDSVWDSVRDSVWDSVRDSVGGSVRDSVWDSVRDSVWNSVGDSVRDSVRGYTGSFFKLNKWKYIKHKKGEYPFEPVVILWEKYGLVPSFDGNIWRLHGGKSGKILFEISQKDLKNIR